MRWVDKTKATTRCPEEKARKGQTNQVDEVRIKKDTKRGRSSCLLFNSVTDRFPLFHTDTHSVYQCLSVSLNRLLKAHAKKFTLKGIMIMKQPFKQSRHSQICISVVHAYL
jgi:hypothetical protein